MYIDFPFIYGKFSLWASSVKLVSKFKSGNRKLHARYQVCLGFCLCFFIHTYGRHLLREHSTISKPPLSNCIGTASVHRGSLLTLQHGGKKRCVTVSIVWFSCRRAQQTIRHLFTQPYAACGLRLLISTLFIPSITGMLFCSLSKKTFRTPFCHILRLATSSFHAIVPFPVGTTDAFLVA